jgi:prepilin-type processing-associated H-X9-DG protein
LANGAQGLAIASYPTSGATISIQGVWDDPAHPGSANMVHADGTHVFVAKGKEGGLKIIKKN